MITEANFAKYTLLLDPTNMCSRHLSRLVFYIGAWHNSCSRQTGRQGEGCTDDGRPERGEDDECSKATNRPPSKHS